MSLPPLPTEEIVNAALAHIAAGRLGHAETVLAEAAADAAEDPALRRALAGLAAASGRPEEAEAILTAIVGRDPADAQALADLARLHDEAGRTDAARRCFTASLAARPDDRPTRRAFALHLLADEPRRALGEVETALAADRNDVDTLKVLADVLAALGDTAGARRVVDHALAQCGGDAPLWTMRGVLAREACDLEVAVASLRRARLHEPHAPLLLAHLAEALAAGGLAEAAVPLAMQAARTGAQDPVVMTLLARTWRRCGDFAAAARAADQALAHAPGSSEAALEAATAHRWRGDLAAARGAVDAALRHRPGHAPAILARGEIAIEAGDVAAGLRDLDVVHAGTTPRRGRWLTSLAQLDNAAAPLTLIVGALHEHALLAARLLPALADRAADLKVCGPGAAALAALVPVTRTDRVSDEDFVAPFDRLLALIGEHDAPALVGPPPLPAPAASPHGAPAHLADDPTAFAVRWQRVAPDAAAIAVPAQINDAAAVLAVREALGRARVVYAAAGWGALLAGSLGRPGVVLVPPNAPWWWRAEGFRRAWFPSLTAVRMAGTTATETDLDRAAEEAARRLDPNPPGLLAPP